MKALHETQAELDQIARSLIAGTPIPRAYIESWRQWRDDHHERLTVRLQMARTDHETPRSVEFAFRSTVAGPEPWELIATSADWL